MVRAAKKWVHFREPVPVGLEYGWVGQTLDSISIAGVSTPRLRLSL